MEYDVGDLEININIDLTKYVDKFKDLELMLPYIVKGTRNGIDELADRLEQKVIENLNKYGLGSSNLANTIQVIPDANGISVIVNAEYGMYVEYGTGIKGANAPHPHPWQYDINGHGSDGWVYKGDDGKLHWTAGMKSRPFMYDSWLWGTRSAHQIISKNIRNELKKIKGMKG